MPNWCYCELSVVGRGEERNRFKKFAEGDKGGLDFNSFISYPEPFKRMDEISQKLKESGVPWAEIPRDGFNSGGYEWCVRNWGTKWNVNDNVEIIEKPRSLLYKFDTAWTPPKPAIYVMAEMFPELRFNLKYWEKGMGFQGQLMIKNDMLLKDWER